MKTNRLSSFFFVPELILTIVYKASTWNALSLPITKRTIHWSVFRFNMLYFWVDCFIRFFLLMVLLLFFFVRCCGATAYFFGAREFNKCIWMNRKMAQPKKEMKYQNWINQTNQTCSKLSFSGNNIKNCIFVSFFFHMCLDPLNVMLSVVNVHKPMFRIYFWWFHWDQSHWRAKIMCWWKVDAYVNRNMPQKP